MEKSAIPVSELLKTANVQPEAKPTATPIASTTVTPAIRPTKIKVDKATRAIERVNSCLDQYLNAENGSRVKIKALQDLTELVCANPKKNILDTVYHWFSENRNSDALNARNALQGLQTLSPSSNLKTRILYQVMSKLTSGEPRVANLNLDTIQGILGEEVSAWVAAKTEAIKRRRR